MSDTPLLQLNQVSRYFKVSRGLGRGSAVLRALDDITLSLHDGEVLGLVGESGCGKSTLAKVLLGLMPPTAGRVLVSGRPMENARRREVSRRIQPVFQDPYSSLNPRKTVAEIIAFPLEVHGLGDRASRRDRVLEVLDLVGLPRHMGNNYPGQMSGGQRQRVAVARALAMRPEILILDEPTSAFDVSVQSQILNLLMDLREELGLTYLMISHNLAVVEHMASRVAVMYMGRIIETGPAAEIFARPRHPYTQALLRSVLSLEPGRGIPDSHLGAAFPNPIDPPDGCMFHPRCASVQDICRTLAPVTVRTGEARIECHLYGGPCQGPQ